jgi:small subunit ribosomal protein S20
MPNTKSAKADLTLNAIRREHNRGRKSSMRTAIKKTLIAIEAGDVATAEASLLAAQKIIDKNVKWNQLHANTGARRKSSLARAVAALKK